VLFAAMITTGAWILRVLDYCYQSGVFSIYSINNKYIQIDDGFLYQMAQFLAILIIFLIINYAYLYIATSSDKSKFGFKRKLKILLFYLVEITTCFFLIFISAGYGINSIITELGKTKFLEVIVIFGMMLILACTFNILGIQMVRYYKRSKKKTSKGDNEKDDESPKSTKGNIKTTLLFTFLILISVMVPITYYVGIFEEHQRTNFKIIKEPITETNSGEKEYVFTSENNSYILYPIIYENQDIYIISRVFIDGNKICIDKSYQKVIDKQDVITYTVDNIYDISTK
jgi:hypothetical protein